MISKKAVKYLGKMINLGFVCGVFPYRWNAELDLMEYPKSPLRLLYFMFELTLVLLYQGFTLVRCLEVLESDTESHENKFVAVYKLLGSFVGSCSHIVTILTYGKLHCIINSCIRIAQSYQRDQEIRRKDLGLTAPLKIASPIQTMRGMKFVYIFICFSYLLKCITQPNSPELITSIAERPERLEMWIRVLAGLAHFWLYIFHVFAVVIYPIICVFYMRTVKCMVLELSTGAEGGSPCEEVVRYYVQLQVLQGNFNGSLGVWVFVWELTCIYMVIMNTFQIIVFNSFRGLVIATILLTSVVVVFNLLGQLENLTRSLLDALNEDVANDYLATGSADRLKWWRTFRKSVRPLNVSVGSFFFVDPGLTLTLITIIVDKTIFMVVTYRS